jgi:hypothetical protein
LAADPPVYEILFLALLDDDHRVARVAFPSPLSPGISQQEAFMVAASELERLSHEEILAAARTADLTVKQVAGPGEYDFRFPRNFSG